MNYRPETRARAILGLTEAHQSAPPAYGDIDLDQGHGRRLRALDALRRIADRLPTEPTAWHRHQALDEIVAVLQLDADAVARACAEVDAAEAMAMAMAMKLIWRRNPRQGPPRPPVTGTVTQAPAHRARLAVVPDEQPVAARG